MYDFFWFSDSRRARIAPLLPTDVRGRKNVDDRRVPSGIVHALRCGGRRADCADIHGPKKTLCNRFARRAARVYGKVSSALRQALRIRLTGCSSTAPASRFIAAPAAEKGALAHGIGRTKGGCNTGLHAVRDHKGRPMFLSTASCSRRPETCMIARSHSAASRPCRHPPNLSPARAVTAGNCANGLKNAGPGPSSRRERTARSDIPTIRPSTVSEISSNACSAASRTGGAHIISQLASSATLKTSWRLSRAPQPSSRGYNESRP